MLKAAVKSSNIAALAWANSSLYISFHNGDVYVYHDVEIEVYLEAIKVESVGKHFHKVIKGAYPYQKLSADEIADLGLAQLAPTN